MTTDSQVRLTPEEEAFLQEQVHAEQKPRDSRSIPVAKPLNLLEGVDRRRLSRVQQIAAAGLEAVFGAVLDAIVEVRPLLPEPVELPTVLQNTDGATRLATTQNGPSLMLLIPVGTARIVLDRMLGEPALDDPEEGEDDAGALVPEPPHLTSVDQSLLDEVFALLVDEFSAEPLAVKQVEHMDDSAREAFVQANVGFGWLRLGFQIRSDSFGGNVAILMSNQQMSVQAPRRSGKVLAPNAIGHLQGTISMQLGRASLRSGDLAELQPGIVVPLGQRPDGAVRLLVEGQVRFDGILRRRQGRRVVEITRLLK